jgi:hypothetical protein
MYDDLWIRYKYMDFDFMLWCHLNTRIYCFWAVLSCQFFILLCFFFFNIIYSSGNWYAGTLTKWNIKIRRGSTGITRARQLKTVCTLQLYDNTLTWKEQNKDNRYVKVPREVHCLHIALFLLSISMLLFLFF